MKRAHPDLRRRRQRGMSLIELLIAMLVLAIGMAGAMILVSTAIAGNNRNKLDTTATLLSQMVLEKIMAPGNSNLPPVPTGAIHWVPVTDCTGATFRVYLDPGGPVLNPANPSEIDWTIPPPATGYNMFYTVCKAGGQTAMYEVRWNITAIKSSPNTIYTKLITVAARPMGAAKNSQLKGLFFGLPITLRGVSGVSPN